MARMFFDGDADLSHVEGMTTCIVGYGNQGRSQALNMRDSGLDVIVGSQRDESHRRATEDGFEVLGVADAVVRGDIIFFLVPDEVMPKVFSEEIAPGLAPGNAIVFASGYNIAFDLVQPPNDVDVVMIAPRMIGAGVRDTFVEGIGFPSLMAVHQAATDTAFERTLALCKAIGSTRMGVIESSFLEEAIVDLFAEHAGFLYSLRRYCEVLVEAGCSAEVAMLEFYASGEAVETAKAYRDLGLWPQITLHSRTSQYGQEVTGRLSEDEEAAERARLHGLIEHIRSGAFAREWAREQETGQVEWNRTRRENLAHEMYQAERRLYAALGRSTGDGESA